MVLLQDQELPPRIRRMTMSRRKKIFLALATSVFVIMFICYFMFIRIIKVPTGSMANNVIPGDRLIVTKLFGDIKRGDVIVFQFPEDPSVQYLSRVIGLPGESIEIKDSRVYINNEELKEIRVFVEEDTEILPMSEISSEGDGSYRVFYYSREEGVDDIRMEMMSQVARFGTRKPHKIAEGNYFVMGDNRDNSADSRFWGTVPENLVTGKALRILFNQQNDNTSKEFISWERFFAIP